MIRPPPVTIDSISGNCPVQAEGTIGDKLFYFRARGARWSIDIGGEDPCARAEWSYTEPFGAWPEAGWMEPEQAEWLIRRAARLYAETRDDQDSRIDPLASCPSDLVEWGRRHGIPTFAAFTWAAGFAAGQKRSQKAPTQ